MFMATDKKEQKKETRFVLLFFILMLMHGFVFHEISFLLTDNGRDYAIDCVTKAETQFINDTGEIAFGRLRRDTVTFQLLDPYLKNVMGYDYHPQTIINSGVDDVLCWDIEIYPDSESINGYRIEARHKNDHLRYSYNRSSRN